MINPIKQIHDFNHKAGLIENGYDDSLESSFLIEEALEGFSNDRTFDLLTSGHDAVSAIPETMREKHLARSILSTTGGFSGTDVDRLDKACDAVVFAVGSMTKLGLNPVQITRALNVVMNANTAKLGCKKDEHGKLTKPDNWEKLYAPEPKLQAILDER